MILSYDLGNGIRVEKGGEIFSQWTGAKESPELPRQARLAIEFLTRYFRYTANLVRLGKASPQVACYVRACHLVAPALPGALNYDLNALALLLRDGHGRSHIRITGDLPHAARNDHPSSFNRASVHPPFTNSGTLTLSGLSHDFRNKRASFVGASVNSIEELLKLKEHAREAIQPTDLVELKKSLVEKDCGDLIEFIDSKRTLDDVHGQDKLKVWLRQDVLLWKQAQFQALPMGYLVCGPVGTGKTFLVECLAGEAGISATSGSAPRKEIWRKSFDCSMPWDAVSSSSTKPTRHSASGIPGRMTPDCPAGSIQ